ncbi:uncharacterized protein I303_106219 [Kwoniella dejecticola CBS 10117]|uniref:Thioesterase domain-containing protein n=1 Tax=Kwoniella dejecticola CBS 10117 TaxID=1296121 RepID=A0A1A6A1L6_9TREE|nr:uncharacterized protein I303_06238 [Kwoniella dejecticola CBS 10117]OBR83951.1 hypothetical protein I303_06238 [Kwoniella dejecticola CBS 10117]
MPKPTQEDQEFFQRITGSAGYGAHLTKHFSILEIDDVPPTDARGWRKVDGFKMSFRGVVTEEMSNLSGNMHGAAYSWILDTCSSATLIAIHTPTFWGLPDFAGVTLTMELQCLNPASMGTKLLIEVEIVKCSVRLANLRCDIKNLETGKPYATGTHLKIWKGPPDDKRKGVEAKL